mmetsp:Transcript_9011/g.27965  ORF Transcript_9011/g.27965 Transcript_9011/m.27965 type:complete len:243 (-) Transcript_9011:1180-1908(-)
MRMASVPVRAAKLRSSDFCFAVSRRPPGAGPGCCCCCGSWVRAKAGDAFAAAGETAPLVAGRAATAADSTAARSITVPSGSSKSVSVSVTDVVVAAPTDVATDSVDSSRGTSAGPVPEGCFGGDAGSTGPTSSTTEYIVDCSCCTTIPSSFAPPPSWSSSGCRHGLISAAPPTMPKSSESAPCRAWRAAARSAGWYAGPVAVSWKCLCSPTPPPPPAVAAPVAGRASFRGGGAGGSANMRSR